MKIINSLVVLILAFFILGSCQKELNFDDVGGNSVGGLKYDDATHDCYPSTVNGQYIVDTVLNSDNFIDVQVNITSTGAYAIQSDTTNGYSFRGTGNLGAPGLNMVRLYGTGKPLAAQPDQFIIRYDTSVCIIDVTVLATVINADYSFAGAGGTCTGAVLSGTYMQGVAMDAADSVVISVDVTAVGNYTISSSTLDGVTFSGAGAFTVTGPQTVTLAATGIATASGTSTFPLAGASQGCAFSVTVDAPASPATFTLGGNPGSCTGVTLTGTYEATVPTQGSNTATIDVNVTATGTYSISTNTVNGMVFTSSGMFTSTGPQSVVLNAGGTPAVAGPFNYIVTGGSSTCTFPVTVL